MKQYNLRQVLKQHGWSLEKLAPYMTAKDGTHGTSTSSVSQLLNGNPTLAKLDQISQITGIPLSTLFSDPADLKHCFTAIIKYHGKVYVPQSPKELQDVARTISTEKHDDVSADVPFTARIKDILKQRGLSQQALADKLEVSISCVRQTLNSPSVRLSNLERMAKALDVPTWHLLADPKVVCKESLNAAISYNGQNYTPTTIDELLRIADDMNGAE